MPCGSAAKQTGLSADDANKYVFEAVLHWKADESIIQAVLDSPKVGSFVKQWPNDLAIVVHTLDTLKKVYPPTFHHIPDLLTRGPYVGTATAAGGNHATVPRRNYHVLARLSESQPPRELRRMRRRIAPLHCATGGLRRRAASLGLAIGAGAVAAAGHALRVLGHQ